jgi:hypothetical protein
MSTSNITPQQILDALQHVPEDRWPDVLETIERLQRIPQSEPQTTSPVRTGTDLRGSDLIGIWADHTDVSDSREFAQELRRRAEQRN